MTPVLIVVAAVAAILIASGAPLVSLLPFAIVLACPLMMFMMMRGMGGMHEGGADHTGHGCEHDPTGKAEAPSNTLR